MTRGCREVMGFIIMVFIFGYSARGSIGIKGRKFCLGGRGCYRTK